MSASGKFRRIGKVHKPHGIKGAFLIYVESDFPDWLMERERFFARVRGRMEPWTVTSARRHGDRLIFTVDAVPDRTTAEAVRGAELFLPEDEARSANLDPDYFFNSDLVGLTLRDHQNSVSYGSVRDVLEMPAQNLLEVARTEGGTFWFPFTKELVHEVDLGDGVIRVTMPDGLIECNDPDAGDEG